jgi:HlyD family secretion protein
MISSTDGQDEIISNPTNKKPWIKLIIGAVVVIGIIWFILPTLSQWSGGIPSVNPQTITRATVVNGTLIRDIAVNGKLVAANAPTIYSSEPGQVTLLAKPGDIVKKDAIVATILSPELQSTVKQATAKLESLKIDARRSELRDREAQLDLEQVLDTARVRANASTRELTRAELSYEKQVVSQLYLVSKRDAKLEDDLLFEHAKKRVELAIQRLEFENKTRDLLVKSQQLVVDELQRRVELLNIRAPVDGIVGNWLVQKKERVSDTQAIMTIVDLSQYEAELNVPEFYADDLGLGLTIAMQISGVDVRGEIIAISPEIKNNQVKVRAKLVSKSGIQLRQNQRINARIEFENRKDVLMLKRGAFLGSFAGEFAFKKLDGYTAQKIAISTGISSVDYIELISGVTEGDQIITSDYQRFNNAEQININD